MPVDFDAQKPAGSPLMEHQPQTLQLEQFAGSCESILPLSLLARRLLSKLRQLIAG